MNAGSLIAGKYRLTQQIGEGAMGVVWEAKHEGTSRRVAVKLIVRPTDELRHRLIREARACGALRHRNIVDIYDVGTTDEGDPFLVMQLLVGETLAQRLARKRRLEAPEAARIGRDVARALAATHAASIIHRDLKPANIFLHDEPGEEETIVKVLDFGVSKNQAVSDGLMTVAGGVVGSPAYMSPEQAGAGGVVDSRADLWSLGVVLFEMLTGRRPLDGDAATIVPQILTAEIPRVSKFVRIVDAGLDALVARCLERDLGKRIATADALATALEPYTTPGASALISGGAALAPRPPLASMAELEASRSSRLQASAVSVVAPPRGGGTLPIYNKPRVDPAPAFGDASSGRTSAPGFDGAPPSIPGSPTISSTAPVLSAGVHAAGPARWRTALLVAGAVVGVALAIPVVVAIRAVRGREKGPEAAPMLVVSAAPRAAVVSSVAAVPVLPTAVPALPTAVPVLPTAVPSAEAAPSAATADPAPVGMGLLNMSSIPVSRVMLDGKPLGNTPKMGVSVTEGTHTVIFNHPSLGRKTIPVQVKAGETKTAAVNFNK